MDKEVKQTIRKLLWLDSLLISKDSLWNILDDIEDELDEIFGNSKGKEMKIEDLLKIKK